MEVHIPQILTRTRTSMLMSLCNSKFERLSKAFRIASVNML